MDLSDYGDVLMSRSEAKRIADGLERFAAVELDFAKVTDVGQGFADELFRVWPTPTRTRSSKQRR